MDLPRLSVDIDVNYIGAADRDTMLAERPKIETALKQVVSRLEVVINFRLRRWRLYRA